MRIPFEEVKAEIKSKFIKYGLSEEKAELCAQIHTESSCDGIYSHGTNRVPRFIDYIKKGWVDVNADPTIEKEFGSLVVMDGHMGPGITNAFKAVDKAIEVADKNGIGLVGLHNTTHWMRGGTYGLYAANKGYVCLSWTNTESAMPAWGSKEQNIGNNPMVIAAPGKDNPVMMDMAMSQFSYGKLQVAKLADELMPFNAGYDHDGQLTREPAPIIEDRRILPMGYWKGSAMAFMLDVVAAILSDGKPVDEIDKIGKGSGGGSSQVFIVIDPEKINIKERVYEIVRSEIEHIQRSEKVDPNGEIRYPGEGYVNDRKVNEAQGILIDESVWEKIKSL